MAKSRPFTFKRFTVTQERAAMKVGTDGVLLGAWCTVEAGMQRALDIGTGTGLIALMLAQRGESTRLTVDAIEPEGGAFDDAAENISASPWPENINLHGLPLQQFNASHKYDLIVCNPPYFTSSLTSPSQQRTTARHDVNLSREELVKHIAEFCKPQGRFAVIIPTEQAGDYITECDMKGLAAARRTDVRTTLSAPPKRTLIEFVYRPEKPSVCERGELIIETSPLCHTPQYIRLTRDFYLKF